LLDPRQLIAAERVVIAGGPGSENELVAAQLKRVDSAFDSSEHERTRLLDACQAGLVEPEKLTRRTATVTAQRDKLVPREGHAHQAQRRACHREPPPPATCRLRQRVAASLDELDVEGRRRLLRLVVEKVRVTGWRVAIQLKIPLASDDHSREFP
jgi:hypothetical protein